jgi:hypothetical protein
MCRVVPAGRCPVQKPGFPPQRKTKVVDRNGPAAYKNIKYSRLFPLKEFPMRGLVAVVLATSVFASAVSAATLSPGKPAGVEQAQMSRDTLFIIGGVALAGLGIGLAASGGNNFVTPATSTSTTTTTTTRTTSTTP